MWPDTGDFAKTEVAKLTPRPSISPRRVNFVHNPPCHLVVRCHNHGHRTVRLECPRIGPTAPLRPTGGAAGREPILPDHGAPTNPDQKSHPERGRSDVLGVPWLSRAGTEGHSHAVTRPLESGRTDLDPRTAVATGLSPTRAGRSVAPESSGKTPIARIHVGSPVDGGGPGLSRVR